MNTIASKIFLAMAIVFSSGLVFATMLPLIYPEKVDYGRTVATITNAELMDQNNQLVSEKSLENKLVLMNFFFTGCTNACPIQTAVLRNIINELDNNIDITFISVSLAPEDDTEKAINTYIEKYNLENTDWVFSKTSMDNLDRLLDIFGAATASSTEIALAESSLPANHRNIGYLFGKKGKLMQKYTLMPSMSERMIRDISELNKLAL